MPKLLDRVPHTLHHDYVNVCLMSVLNHAIQLGGANALWLRTRADLLFGKLIDSLHAGVL